MSTLDLHGTKHTEVEDKLTRYFFWDQPGHKQYTIITGNSRKMREIVFEWLDKHESTQQTHQETQLKQFQPS